MQDSFVERRWEDVIFSGTQSRRPMGFAYVAITFENANRIISLDYEEVTVARRVYRSGESEYLINGSSCRRKDIVELFYDTGIGLGRLFHHRTGSG